MVGRERIEGKLHGKGDTSKDVKAMRQWDMQRWHGWGGGERTPRKNSKKEHA